MPAKPVDPKIKITNNRIQLQFVYPPRIRNCFSVGLEDDRDRTCKSTPVKDEHDSINLRITRGIIETIKKDTARGNFDFSKARYRYSENEEKLLEVVTAESISIQKIWENYSNYRLKTNNWEESTHHEYRKFTRIIDKIPNSLSYLTSPNQIQDFFLDNYSQEYSRRIMMQINAACKWASLDSINLIPKNPFTTLPKIREVKNTKGVSNQVFLLNEVHQIVSAFRNDTYVNYGYASDSKNKTKSPRFSHNFYTDYVSFMFLTGCRPEEACELKLGDIYKDYINISRAYRNDIKKVKRTKNFKIRQFPINDQLQEIIDRKTSNLVSKDDCLFPSITGRRFDYRNFPNRTWNVVLNGLLTDEKISRYLPPYNCKHTFLTHALAQGIPPKQLEAWVGTSARVIMDNYAGLLDHIKPPTLYAIDLAEAKASEVAVFASLWPGCNAKSA